MSLKNRETKGEKLRKTGKTNNCTITAKMAKIEKNLPKNDEKWLKSET